MRSQIHKTGFKLWLSTHDTSNWANRPGESWPYSVLRGKRLFAEFDSNGLLDVGINGAGRDCDNTELTAIVGDHILPKLPENHVCRVYFNNQ